MKKKKESKEITKVDTKPKEVALADDPNKPLGVISGELLQSIVVQAAQAMPHGAQNTGVKVIGVSLMEMKPSDPIEAKLLAKEAALYSMALKYLERAEFCRVSENIGQVVWHESDMNTALRLLKAHSDTVDSLSKYRKGDDHQRIVVQHQYVQMTGGQAVIGNVQMPDRGV